jgi:phenylacetate-coenzyme A ligase PaaK-like adenylate-forming protein
MRVPNILVRNFFEPLWDIYEGSVRLKTLHHLRESQFHSPEQILEEQNRKLGIMVRHAARTSPFHGQRFRDAGIDPEGVRSIGDLKDLPLLTKLDIRENLDDILSTDYQKEKLTPAKTGGSTGVALQVYCDMKGIEMRHAAAMRSDEWSGWTIGEPHGAVWGNPPIPETWKAKARAALKDRLIYLDTMKIDTEAIDTFLKQWHTLRPGLLFGHAHSLYILAEDLLARGIKIRPTGIVATSMMLIPSEREVIEEAFAIKVTNRYGCEEVSLISCECEEHNGMHLNADHNIVEFLRDDGTPCEPGEDGRLVITELVNFGMPMIRYEVGDRGIFSDRLCPCGRGLPIMESLSGRTADFLVAEEGYRVAGISIIENSLTSISGLRQMQIVQDKKDHLLVNLVASRDYSEATGEELISSLRRMLGSGMQVELNLVESIPQEKSGKYRFTKCLI